jgi:sugar lactone lactonase YvrE
MRLVGQNTFFNLRGFRLGALFLGLAGLASPLLGQTAPYVLPYTMSTFAGPHAAYTIGAPCTNTNVTPTFTEPALIALDTAGDGCLAGELSIGTDPHDIRVDGQGNVFWDDIGGNSTIHKIAANSLLETAYLGSVPKGKACSTGDKYGDGCPANDGAANTGSFTPTTTGLTKGRGIGLGHNGDLFFADYTGNFDHKVSAFTGIFSVVAGTGTAPTGAPGNGPAGVSTVNSTRGIGVDSNTGNIYVADTTDNVLRMLTPSTVGCTGQPVDSCYVSSTLTAYQSPVVANLVVNNVPASQEYLDNPEDAQVDGNSNVFVAEQANNVIMAIYGGTGPFFGISSPVKGNIYLIAGNPAVQSTNPGTLNTSYPADGTTPTVPAPNVFISVRKMDLDAQGNLYIADSSANVVWFVDHLTGYIRLLAGHFDPTPVPTPPAVAPVPPPSSLPTGCPANPATTGDGDGCPGPNASLYDTSDMGTSPDNQGNLYITDSENATATASRLRKLLSGLNFPATALTGSVTQTIEVHFAAGDTPASTKPFTINGSDFTVGTPSCTTNAPGTFGSAQAEGDNTTDCLVPITFKPTVAGNDTATLTMTSAKGGANTYFVTGTGTSAAIAIDPGSAATFPATVAGAKGVVYDGVGNAYIADTGNNRVLKYTASTQATTVFAGTGAPGYTGDNGAAATATLKAPVAVAVDTGGNLFIADTGNNVIRKVATATGIITTYGGGATTVCATAFDTLGNGCLATLATFNAPAGLTTDNKGVLYVADTGDNVIRQINVFGFVSTVAGGATASTTCSAQTDTFGDGCSAAQTVFNAPSGLAFDLSSNSLLVADTGNNIVRRITLTNTITTGAAGVVTGSQVNPVSLVAGNGNAGSSIDVNSVATLSQLNTPTAVAVDAAGNVYIADSNNSSVRLVTRATGTISTIAGINAANGGTAISGSAPATSVLLSTPSGISITQNGTLLIADTGNNRLLTDTRSQITYNFGRINVNSTSPSVPFSELSIGNAAATLGTPLFTAAGATTQFTLTPSSGSTACTAHETLAAGAACTLTGQFSPTAPGSLTATYTETGTTAAGGTPVITLTGTGAVLTTTTGTVTQTAPATGNSQFGGNVTLSVTIAAACNTAAPTCYPSGTVQLIVDTVSQSPLTLSSTGTASQSFSGLSVGPHTVACSYSGDDFYAASSCPTVTVTVAKASTTALLSATNNNQPQFQFDASTCPQPGGPGTPTICTATVLTATVISNTSGIPTGTVSFFATGGSLSPSPFLFGSSPVNSTTGVASLALTYIVDANGNIVTDASLPPGTYALSCTYSGASNFATSSCAPITFTVLPHPVGYTLTADGCVYNDIYIPGSNTSGKGVICQPVAQTTLNGAPIVATADGSTTDATIFINPSNTFSGTLSFSCSGLPQYSVCTFSPTTLTLTAGTTYDAPVYTDMTLWTDIQPGSVPTTTSSLRGPSIGNGSGGVRYAMILGWPLTLLGFTGLLLFRRRKPGSLRGLSLLAVILLMTGSSLIFTGCAGPGAYQAVLTPAGTYPITVKVTGNGVTQTTLVYFKVASPGITGQQ